MGVGALAWAGHAPRTEPPKKSEHSRRSPQKAYRARSTAKRGLAQSSGWQKTRSSPARGLTQTPLGSPVRPRRLVRFLPKVTGMT